MRCPKTFTKIYDHFRNPILRYVRTRVSDDEAAEDITQEVFLKAFRFRDSYQDRYAISTWLWTIARNTVADHLRGRAPIETDSDVAPDDIASDEWNAEVRAVRRDERRNFLRKLRSLTRMQKRVLWMRIIHQLSYEEISHRMGVSLASAKNLAYRAKLALGAAAESPGFAF
jgi:RNA polymerase sigma-70 factor (ECF subfamily)